MGDGLVYNKEESIKNRFIKHYLTITIVIKNEDGVRLFILKNIACEEVIVSHQNLGEKKELIVPCCIYTIDY